jgi:nifR3 family TIM-barrel protein
MNFWKKLPRPFFVLAPMANVTDAAFRRLITKYGKPDVMYTEFVSANGLVSAGQKKLLVDLKYSNKEQPIVAQLFTSEPDKMYEAAKIIQQLGFAGLDINMGCPDKNVVKQGAGAALINQNKLAQELINAAKRGAPKLPISVKTRIGQTKNDLTTWLPALLKAKPAAIIIHGRTRKEMSKVEAHWDTIKQAVQIAKGSGVLIIGNGDVKNLADGKLKAKQTGCTGIMIGRAVFGNPWLFNKKIDYQTITPDKKLKVMLEHTKLFEKLLGQEKSFHIMRKHYKAYTSGFDGAKELRIKLMQTESLKEVEKIVKKFKI